MLLNTTNRPANGCPSPGLPVHTVTEQLARHRLNVQFPDPEDNLLLKVTGTGSMHCRISLDEEDGIACEYSCEHVQKAPPREIAASVARMTGVDYTDPERYSSLHKGVTLAGAVGRDLKARGLTVTLHVTEDNEIYTALAEIIITNPGEPGRGKVHLADDGWLYWECYADELPGGTAELASTIAATLTPTQPVTARHRLRDRLRRRAPKATAPPAGHRV